MRIATTHPGGSKDHKCLVYTGREHSFGSEDDMRLVPTGSRHSLWTKDDEQQRCCHQLLVLVWAACDAAKGKAPSPLLGGSKDHKWLVHTGSQHSLGSADDKRLVPRLLRFVLELG